MKIKSYAKVNLGIEIVGKRPDGYHDIRVLFQTIDLADILDFKVIQRDGIFLSGNEASISWGEDNLIFKAARLLKKETGTGKGINIRVKKNIPPGKGLGGGSSNAAVTLMVLNTLWNQEIPEEKLLSLAGNLGADVPYFFHGGFCLGLERGDRIFPKPDLEKLFFLLAFPPFSISTSRVYASLPFSLTSEVKDSKINGFLTHFEFGHLENRLEETVFRLYPQLKDIQRLIRAQGPELLLVTGTGSAVFGLFRKREKAEKAQRELEKEIPCRMAESVSRSEYRKGVKFGV